MSNNKKEEQAKNFLEKKFIDNESPISPPTKNNFEDLAKTGMSGICISSAICKSETPYETSRNIRNIVDNICI